MSPDQEVNWESPGSLFDGEELAKLVDVGEASYFASGVFQERVDGYNGKKVSVILLE